VVFATLFGASLTRAGDAGKPVLEFFEGCAKVMFKYTDMVMRLTPLGVFGAMAYNVSHMAAGHPGSDLKGWPAVLFLLGQYARLVGSLYFALVCLFALVFVPVMWICGLRVRTFLRAIRDPALTAFSTASSEAALPRLLEDMVAYGVPRSVASFVIPTGYSFNLDAFSIYLTLVVVFIAQATNTPLSLGDLLIILGVSLVTSKGAHGVPGSAIVILAATLHAVPAIPAVGLTLVLSVDWFVGIARAVGNLVGNCVATIVVGAATGGLDLGKARETLARDGAVEEGLQ